MESSSTSMIQVHKIQFPEDSVRGVGYADYTTWKHRFFTGTLRSPRARTGSQPFRQKSKESKQFKFRIGGENVWCDLSNRTTQTASTTKSSIEGSSSSNHHCDYGLTATQFSSADYNPTRDLRVKGTVISIAVA